jgi:Ca2+-binding EF-hand superfamily protein
MNAKKRRLWLCSRGKGHLLDFTDPEVAKLRECFEELDADGGGSIGLDELEEPLIGLGIANTREEVNDLIMKIDDDGEIQFSEFL